MRTRIYPFFVFGIVAVAGLVPLAADSAPNDLKIVSEVTITRGEAVKHITYTTVYRGQRARLQASDGTIVIFDRAADSIYTLTPDRKTYYIRSFSEALKAGSQLPQGTKDRMSVHTSVRLDEIKDGDKVQMQSLAGQNAGRYSLLATSSLRAKESNSGGRMGGGGFPGGRGGGFPGGGGRGGMPPGGGGGTPSGGGSTPQGRQQSLSFGGEFWAANTEKLLPTGKKDEKEMALAIVGQLLPANSPALGSVAGQLAKKHLLPLSGRMTQRLSDAKKDLRQEGVADGTEVIEMKVVSIDTGALLSEDLFRLPEGYDRVEPPASTSAFTAAGNSVPGGALPVPPQ